MEANVEVMWSENGRYHGGSVEVTWKVTWR